MAKTTDRPIWGETLYRWLSAPLLITVAGALLVNYYIPQVTSKSQNHQRALQIKTDLVKEMSEAGSAAIMTGQLVATDVIKKAGANPNAVFQSGLRDWQIANARIRSEIEGYFPKTSLGQQWTRYSEIVTDTYFLSGSGISFGDRCARVSDIQRFLRAPVGCTPNLPKGQIDWRSLLEEHRTPTYRASYIALDRRLTSTGDQLVKRLLGESPAGF